MSEEFHRFRQHEEEGTRARGEAGRKTGSVEFGSVEEALRADRQRTIPPDQLRDRVAGAIHRETAKTPPWWARWFRRG